MKRTSTTFKNFLVRKLFYVYCCSLALLFHQSTSAQQIPTQLKSSKILKNGFQIDPYVGFDFPTYDHDLPYIEHGSGPSFGLSVNYYWNWFGIGGEVDYIINRTRNTYPTDSIFDPSSAGYMTDFSLQKKNVSRLFYGIGPIFRYASPNDKLAVEFTGRGGMSIIKGGELTLEGTNSLLQPELLNYFSGYDLKNIWSAKADIKMKYFFNDYIGVNFGAYYMQHFNAHAIHDGLPYNAYYKPFEQGDNGRYQFAQKGAMVRENCCNHGIRSIGVYAGVALRLGKRIKPQQEEKVEECKTCDIFNLAITAKDQYTGELLPETDVLLTDITGAVVRTGKTNSFGVLVFNDIAPGNYKVSGKLFGTDLNTNTTAVDEYKPNQTLQKEILYTDRNFIIKGNAVVCNTQIPLSDVQVLLREVSRAAEKTTVSDAQGNFIFHLKENSAMQLYGKKQSYFSQIIDIDASNYDRDNTLFVKLEVCMEATDCDKAIRLQNIHYDLDKYFIREDAKTELNRLVQFMSDNPLVKVELSSHTDSRATHDYNQRLSQNRANAAKDYIVSKGIPAERIVAIGYGETKLLNRCADGVNCSEEDHQLNRRTEMKVICPDKQ
ncbi:OmpA family protein [Sphingobacterium sp. SYP-B4668]|uniref:OmpA family protein n=1 Tax=Sphingobacterium sp. SYP-B4668 TaxID=2996035 RepID=UPI0022DDC2EC|nr:OmpA family protein [Sphingobacterium sp. SYP-B4668]